MAYTTINKSTDHFNTKLYTGNGSNGHAITGVGFQPDWVWLKNRSGATAHVLVDVLRGQNKVLNSNNSGAETTTNANKDFRSFDSDGFTVDTNENFGSTNTNGANIASWCWKANGTGSANTDGSVNSTVSVNTTAGFSICSFTQASSGPITIGHGLGVAPDMIIGKSRGNTSNWQIFHKSLGTGKFIQLNSTAAEQTVANFWGTVNTSIFTIGSNQIEANQPSVYYCFVEKKGYSKFSQYIGNENTNGTFVYTGFKPAWVMIKRTNSGNHWTIYDNKRLGYNNDNKVLYANESASEEELEIDLLSNGFKCRNTDNKVNGSGNPYIFMAFAEEPFVANVGANGVPATAR